MKITCIRDCLVPGKGLVEAGETQEIPKDDTQPWLKHFVKPNGESALAASKPEKAGTGKGKAASKPEKAES